MSEDFEQPQEKKVDSPPPRGEDGGDLGVKVERETTERERVDTREQEQQRVEATAGQEIRETAPLDLVRRRTGPGGSQVERMTDGTPLAVTRQNGDRREFEYENGSLKSIKNFDGSTISSADGGKTWVRKGADGSEVKLAGPPSVDKSGNLRYWDAETGARITEYANRVDVHPGRSTSVTAAEVSELRSNLREVLPRLPDKTTASSGAGADAAAGMKEILREGGAAVEREGRSRTVERDGSQFTYDERGNLSETRAANRQVIKYEYNDKNEIVAVDYGTGKWKTEDGKHWVNENTGKTWNGTVEVDKNTGVYTEKGAGGNYSRTMNSDGSQIWKDRNGDVTEMVNGRGERFKFTLEAPGKLSKVEYPDGSVAVRTGDHWQKTVPQGGEGLAGTHRLASVAVGADGKLTERFAVGITVERTTGGIKTTLDNQGRIREVERYDRSAESFQFESLSGKLIGREIKNPDNSVTTYDAQGRISQVRTASGEIRKFERDQDGKINRITESNGVEWTRSADGKHFVMKSSGERVAARDVAVEGNGTYRFKLENNQEIARNKDGSVSVFDGQGRERSRANNDGSRIEFDEKGRVSASIDARGQRRAYSYGVDGNLDMIKEPDGSVWTSRNGKDWQKVGSRDTKSGETTVGSDGSYTVRNSKGQETTFKLDGSQVSRDERGRVTAVKDADGKERQFQYTADGTTPTRIREADGGVWATRDGKSWVKEASKDPAWKGTISVDRDGTVREKSESGKEVAKRTDGWREVKENGQVRYEHKDKSGAWITKNERGQITEVTDATGKSRKFGYDNEGKLDRVADASGTWTTSDGQSWSKDGAKGTWKGTRELAADGRYREVSQDGKQTVYKTDGSALKLDEKGRTTEITAANGKSRSFEYNERNEIVKVKDTAGGVWTTTDGQNWKQEGSDKTWKGTVSVRPDGTYEEKGATTENRTVHLTDGRSLTYNKSGKILEAVGADGQSTRYQYDERGNATGFEVRNKDGSATTYDGKGLVTKVKDTNNNVREFKYSPDGKLTEMKDAGGMVWTTRDGENWANDQGKGWKGRVWVSPDGTYNYVEGKTLVSKQTDGNTRYTETNGASRLENAKGQITETVDANGLKRTYGYDAQGKIVRQTEGSSVWETRDGSTWTRNGDGAVWHGTVKVEKDGTYFHEDRHGNREWRKPDGAKETADYATMEAAAKQIYDSTYWTLSDGGTAEGQFHGALAGKSVRQRQMMDEIYQRKYGKTIEQEARDEMEGHDLEKALASLKKGDGADDAGTIRVALVERGQIFEGRSRAECERVVRDTLETMSSQQIAEADRQYRDRYGQSLRDAVINDPNLSQKTKDAAGILLKGYDTRTPADERTLVDLALRHSDLTMFQEATRRASPELRTYLTSAQGQQKIYDAFTPSGLERFAFAMCPLGVAVFGDMDRISGTQYVHARDYAELGKLSAATEVRGNTSWLGDNEEAIEHTLLKLTDKERQDYLIGKVLAAGQSLPPDVDAAKLTQQDKDRAVRYYNNLHSALEAAAGKWFSSDAQRNELARWEDMIAVPGGSLVSQLAAHRGNIYDSSTQDVMETIERMEQKDWNRLKSDPAYRGQIREVLSTYLGGSESDPNSEFGRAMAIIDAKKAAKDFEQSTQSRRPVLDAIRDARGFNNDEAAIYRAIENMTAEERQKYASGRKEGNANDPKYREARQFSDHLDQLLRDSLDDSEKAVAFGLLGKVENDPKLPARMDFMDKLRLHASYTDADEAQVVRDIEDAFRADPGLRARIVNPQTDADRDHARAFKETAARAMGSWDYERYAKPLIEAGHLSAELRMQLNRGVFNDSEQGSYTDATRFSQADKTRILSDQAFQKRVFGHLSDEERKIAINAMTQGEMRPEDQLRSHMVGAGTSEQEIRQVFAELRNRENYKKEGVPEDQIDQKIKERLEAVKTAYARKYGSDLGCDLIDELGGRDLREVQRQVQMRTTREEFLFGRDQASQTRSGIGSRLTDAFWDGTGHQLDSDTHVLARLMVEDPSKVKDFIKNIYYKSQDLHSDSKEGFADAMVDITLTGAAIAAAPFTAGASTAYLVYAAMAAATIGAGFKVGVKSAIMGSDYDWGSSQVLLDGGTGLVDAGTALWGGGILKAGRSAGVKAAQETIEAGGKAFLKEGAEETLKREAAALVAQAIQARAPGVTDDAIKALAKNVAKEGQEDAVANLLKQNLSKHIKEESTRWLKHTLIEMADNSTVGLGSAGLSGVVRAGATADSLDEFAQISATSAGFGAFGGAAFTIAAKPVLWAGGHAWDAGSKLLGKVDDTAVRAEQTLARAASEIEAPAARPRETAPVQRLAVDTAPPVRERLRVAPEPPAVGRTASDGLRANEDLVVIGEGGSRADIQGQRQLGKDIVPQLKESGATHLALELPRSAQGDLDAFMAGRMSIDQLKGKLPEEYRGQAYLDMLETARKANKPDSSFGLIAVGDGKIAGTALPLRPEAYMRDTAEQLGEFLQSNPSAKVVLWARAEQADLLARKFPGVPKEVLPDGRALRQAIEQGADGRFRPMSSEVATADEVAAMRKLGLDAPQVGRLKAELNQGQHPADMAGQAMRDNRVLGVGEMHREVNPHRNLFAADVIPELKKNGGTHFAVEIPATEVNQRALDQFMNGQITREELRDILGHRLGGKAMQDSYLEVLDSARQHGLKLVAVDHVDQATTGLVGQRDQFMARKIGAILDADPNNKVVFWVGGEHLKRTPAGEATSAAQILRDKYSVSTIIEQSPTMQDATLRRVAGDLTEPVAVRTAGNQVVEGLPVQHFDYKLTPAARSNLGDYDQVIVYPDAAAARPRPAAAELPAAARLETDVRSGRLYKPEIPAPMESELAALNRQIPELSKATAEDFSARMARVRDSWTDDLTPAARRHQELAPEVKSAHGRLDSEIASLRSQGVKSADIEAARLDRAHPLNQRADLYNKHQEWQRLAGDHAQLTRQIDEVAKARQMQLQQELDRFVKDHKLPPVELKIGENMHAAGGYDFGKGVITVPKADLIGTGGKAGLSRNVYHELVHLEQDQLLVRNSIQATALDGKPMDVKAVRDHYQAATGRELDPEFLKNVVARSEGKPPLTLDDVTRADDLAKAVNDVRRPVAEESADLGNSARVVLGKLDELRTNPDGQAVNRLFKQLFDEPGGDNLARRLFGDGPVPPDVVQQVRKWDGLPKDPATGLRVGFDAEEARQLLSRHLDQRLDQVNNQHKALIDGYAGSRLEREAYGLDSQVKEPAIAAPQVSRLATGTSGATAQPVPRQAPEERMELRRNRIAELERSPGAGAERVRELGTLRQQHLDDVQRASRELRTADRTLEGLEEIKQKRPLTSTEEELFKTSMKARTELKEALRIEREIEIRRLIDQAPQAGDRGGFAGRSGRGGDDTQNLIFNQLQREMKTPMEALRGRTPEQAGFIIVPMRAGSAIDSIGGDYLLINKNTGEFIPIDASQRVKSDLPKLRQENVITSNPNDPSHGEPGTPSWQASRQREIQDQFRGIVTRFRKDGSALYVLDTPVPPVELPFASTRYESRLAVMKDDARIRSLLDKERLAALDAIQDPARRQDLIREWKHEAQQKQNGLNRLTRDMDELARELKKSGDAGDIARARHLEEYSKHTSSSTQVYLRRLINNDLSPREGRAELQILNAPAAKPGGGRQGETVSPPGRRQPARVERLEDEADPGKVVPSGGDKPAGADAPDARGRFGLDKPAASPELSEQAVKQLQKSLRTQLEDSGWPRQVAREYVRGLPPDELKQTLRNLESQEPRAMFQGTPEPFSWERWRSNDELTTAATALDVHTKGGGYINIIDNIPADALETRFASGDTSFFEQSYKLDRNKLPEHPVVYSVPKEEFERILMETCPDDVIKLYDPVNDSEFLTIKPGRNVEVGKKIVEAVKSRYKTQ